MSIQGTSIRAKLMVAEAKKRNLTLAAITPGDVHSLLSAAQFDQPDAQQLQAALSRLEEMRAKAGAGTAALGQARALELVAAALGYGTLYHQQRDSRAPAPQMISMAGLNSGGSGTPTVIHEVILDRYAPESRHRAVMPAGTAETAAFRAHWLEKAKDTYKFLSSMWLWAFQRKDKSYDVHRDWVPGPL